MHARILALTALALAPVLLAFPAQADPSPHGCLGLVDPGAPRVGDGLNVGDVGNEDGRITYGCQTGALSNTRDIDGFWAVPLGPGDIEVIVFSGCLQVDWQFGIPAYNVYANLCAGQSMSVGTPYTEIMRLHLQKGPARYAIQVTPL